jgi:hypothetical protein
VRGEGDSWRQIRRGGGTLVLIPLLNALIFLAIVVFVFVEKWVNHGRIAQVQVVIIGVTPAALPLTSTVTFLYPVCHVCGQSGLSRVGGSSRTDGLGSAAKIWQDGIEKAISMLYFQITIQKVSLRGN